ncbi:MAG: ABC transporter permease [Chloracidobacterium sp.]|nr:ABC transporter permease [Chloracidobacterium sp.]
MLRKLFYRLSASLRRGKIERQMERELRFHVEMETAEKIRRGMSEEDARRSAMLSFGGVERTKEELRDARGLRWLEDLPQDLRYTLRILRRNPAFAAVTLLTLALGIGATTVMFTVINSVLLKPLPYREPDRLVTLQEQTEKATQYGNLWAFAYPNYLDCKRESRFLDMAAKRYSGGTVSANGNAEYVVGREVSSDLFSVLGIDLVQGRPFLPDEDRLGAAPVIIVSYSLWQRLFAGNPAAIGTPLVMDGKPFTIVGVAPAGFRLDGEEPGVFTPLGQKTSPNMQMRDRHPGIQVLARLRSGATLDEAQADLALIGRHLAEQYPESNAGRSFIADPLRPDVGDAGTTLWLLMGAVILVLLIACVNVASLLLARAVSRERELAIRVVLGAGRSRIMRQCLTESAVLGISGGALGILSAAVGIRPFVMFWPGALPRAEEVHLDWQTLLFALTVSLLSSLIFGLAPALRAPARELEQTLRAGARTVAGSSRRLHSGFVIAEVALAVVLLVSAGILGRALLRLSALDPGFNYRNTLVTRMALSADALANPKQIRAAWQEVLERARRVPGVVSVATVDTVPMREGNNRLGYWTTPDVPAPDRQPLALANSVSPDYLAVMGIPLLKGRFFDDHDRLGSELVVVIDDVLAERAFGAQDPIGKYIWIPDSPFSSDNKSPDAARIVGVARHVRYWGFAGDDQAQVRAQFYYPFAQVADQFLRRWSELMSIAVRTSVPPLATLEPLRRELRRATGGAVGDQALYEVRTMEQLASDSLSQQRFLLLLFGIFAGLALLLACVGIYGVLAYLTRQRVPEIGVRMALGANARDCMWLVLRQSLGMTLVGVVLGAAGALAAGRLLESFVPGVGTAEPLTFAVMISVLVVAALLASFAPAYRASRVDPMSAIRQE